MKLSSLKPQPVSVYIECSEDDTHAQHDTSQSTVSLESNEEASHALHDTSQSTVSLESNEEDSQTFNEMSPQSTVSTVSTDIARANGFITAALTDDASEIVPISTPSQQ